MTTHEMTAQEKTKQKPPDRHQPSEPVDPIEPVDEEPSGDEKLVVKDRHQTILPPD